MESPAFDMRVDQTPSLWPDSPKSGRLADKDGYVWKNRLDVGRYARLSPLCQDLVFFTPFSLYAVGFTDAQLLHCSLEVNDSDLKYGLAVFDRPVFEGLDLGHDRRWNHILWAVPKPCWEPLSQSIAAAAIVSDEYDSLVAVQDLEIQDPLDPSSLTPVTVFAFCAITSEFSHKFYGRPPRLRQGRASRRARAFRGARLMGVNPVDAVELSRAEADSDAGV